MARPNPWHDLPEYEVWLHDECDSITKIHSLDFEDAAIEFASQYDQGDYTIIGDDTVTVFVKYNDVVKQFRISGEMVHTYYAQEIVKINLN